MVPLARNIQGCADRNGRWSLKWRNSLRRWNSGDRLALDLYVWIKRRTSSNQAHCHFRSLQEGSEKTERASFRSYLQQRPRARDEREAEVINCCGRWDKLFWTVKNTLPWTERLLTMLRDFFFFLLLVGMGRLMAEDNKLRALEEQETERVLWSERAQASAAR